MSIKNHPLPILSFDSMVEKQKWEDTWNQQVVENKIKYEEIKPTINKLFSKSKKEYIEKEELVSRLKHLSKWNSDCPEWVIKAIENTAGIMV